MLILKGIFGVFFYNFMTVNLTFIFGAKNQWTKASTYMLYEG